MKNRDDGLDEIYNRIYNDRHDLGLKAFKRNPTRPINKDYIPCIFMLEGIDEVITPSSRNANGYPCRRMLEVTLEMITGKSVDVKDLYRRVRSTIFSEGVVVADDNTFINEIRTEGPSGYGLPDILGMRLVLALYYTDKGI